MLKSKIRKFVIIENFHYYFSLWNNLGPLYILFVILSVKFINADPCANTKKDWIENSKGCDWAYNCVKGRLISEIQCKDGRWFDPIGIKCTNNRKDISCRFDEYPSITCPDEGKHYYQHEYSCRQYFECDNGELSKRYCNITQAFSPIKKECMPAKEAECIVEPEHAYICPVIKDTRHIELVSSKLDCETYYICFHSGVAMKKCAPGLHFDQRQLWCDLPKRAKCLVGNCRFEQTITLTIIFFYIQVDPVEELPETTETTPTPTTTPIPFICPEEGIIFVPHPENCDQYYICFHGDPLRFTCPSGLIFDIFKRECTQIEIGICAKDFKSTTALSSEASTVTAEISTIPQESTTEDSTTIPEETSSTSTLSEQLPTESSSITGEQTSSPEETTFVSKTQEISTESSSVTEKQTTEASTISEEESSKPTEQPATELSTETSSVHEESTSINEISTSVSAQTEKSTSVSEEATSGSVTTTEGTESEPTVETTIESAETTEPSEQPITTPEAHETTTEKEYTSVEPSTVSKESSTTTLVEEPSSTAGNDETTESEEDTTEPEETTDSSEESEESAESSTEGWKNENYN